MWACTESYNLGAHAYEHFAPTSAGLIDPPAHCAFTADMQNISVPVEQIVPLRQPCSDPPISKIIPQKQRKLSHKMCDHSQGARAVLSTPVPSCAHGCSQSDARWYLPSKSGGWKSTVACFSLLPARCALMQLTCLHAYMLAHVHA